MIAIGISEGEPSVRPSLRGFEATDGEWRLEAKRYGRFVRAVTGVAIVNDLTGSDCYRIGNRLEAFVETRKRRGEWTPELVEEYPDVESREEILGLARFFRQCHVRRIESDV